MFYHNWTICKYGVDGLKNTRGYRQINEFLSSF